MAPKELVCRDLQSGDIMMQQSLGNAPGRLIAFGQFMTGHSHAEIIHAGIMYDTSYIIEALGGGVLANDIRVGNVKCGYVVFRPNNPTLGTIAGNLAKLLFDSHGIVHNLNYSTLGAVASIGGARPAKSADQLDGMVDRIFSAKSNNFFCSQFVAVVYQIAGGQLGMSPKEVIPLDDAKIAPARLQTAIEASALFSRVGIMLPNKR